MKRVLTEQATSCMNVKKDKIWQPALAGNFK